MAAPVNPPVGKRDEAVEDWEGQNNPTLLGSNQKKKLGTVAIALIASAALVSVYFLKNFSSKENSSGANVDSNLTVAPRKPVPKLNDPVEEPAPVKTTSTPETPAIDQIQAQQAQLELQRKEKERQLLEARMKSSIDPGGVQSMGAAPADMSSGQINPSALVGGSVTGERGAQDSNSRFARSVSGQGVAISQASDIDNLEFKILQGKIIEAVVVPRAISDLPGTICALVQRDVYAERGRIKLIPWGSRMCGVYSAEIRKGQNRIFTMWNTLRAANEDGTITEVALDSIGADQLGTSGMGGLVDTHFAEIFGTSALLSIIGAGASNAGVSSSDQNNSSAQYRQSVQQAAAQTSQSTLAPYINMPPTITVPAGSRIRVFVNRDLDFSQIYQKKSDAALQQDGVLLID